MTAVSWEPMPFRQRSVPLGEVLAGRPPTRPAFTIEPVTIEPATIEPATRAGLAEYHELRRAAFVDGYGLFSRHDRDARDDDPRLVVLLARDRRGTVLGGVRLGPVTDTDIGWWFGGRLVVSPAGQRAGGVGAALVRAAQAHAETAGVLRFEAEVRAAATTFFTRLGWTPVRPCTVAGQPHTVMRAPIGRLAAHARVKTPLGVLLGGLHPGGPGFVGDDGAPVPGSDLVAACDAILPAMVERDPEWAGWCSVLVNVNDLAAMGAQPVGLLDAVAGPGVDTVAAALRGLRAAAAAYGVPVLGGHTQLGVPAALSVTALGRTSSPVPGGGGRPGHELRLTADLGGGWRPGYTGRQWDSTSNRHPSDLRTMIGAVRTARPAAAKDVSMAGVAGTLGMLAEASGCAAVLDVAAVPRPGAATMGDWLSCFPGFAMATAAPPGAPALPAGPAVGAVCGELVAGAGVRLRWPDGELTEAVPAAVTGLGPASPEHTREVSG